MSESLDEFFEKYEAAKRLKENLKTNIDALTDLKKREKEALLRCHLIMICQCLQDFGAE